MSLKTCRGRVYEYKGPRDKENLVHYMREQSRPPSEEKTYKLAIDNAMSRSEVTVVGFFNKDSHLFKEYMTAANVMRGTFA